MKLIFAAIVLLLMPFSANDALAEPNEDCPRTLGSNKVLGPPFPASDNWYGSEALAVMLPPNGIWPTTGDRASIAVKLFLWSAGFEPGMESNLSVEVSNLDGRPNNAVASDATNANAPSLGGWTMLVGLDFPSPGCWQVAADYFDQSLTFVVEVVDQETYRRNLH